MDQKFNCDICDKSFGSKSNLTKHERVNLKHLEKVTGQPQKEKKSLECKHGCGKVLTRSDGKAKHEKLCKSNPDYKPKEKKDKPKKESKEKQTKEFKCDKCNHVFTRKLALNKHSCKGDDAKRIIKEKITNKQSEISKIKGRISNIVRKYENVITYNVSLNDQDDYLKNLKKQIYEMKEVPSRLKLKTLFKINKILKITNY